LRKNLPIYPFLQGYSIFLPILQFLVKNATINETLVAAALEK
jgi:hypothetical protein